MAQPALGHRARLPWRSNLFMCHDAVDADHYEESMIFHLDSYFDVDENVALMILQRGGFILDSFLEDPYTIVVSQYGEDANPNSYDCDRFDIQFVRDSFADQKLKDLNQYLIGQSIFCPYDANQILHRRLKWSDIKRKPRRPFTENCRKSNLNDIDDEDNSSGLEQNNNEAFEVFTADEIGQPLEFTEDEEKDDIVEISKSLEPLSKYTEKGNSSKLFVKEKEAFKSPVADMDASPSKSLQKDAKGESLEKSCLSPLRNEQLLSKSTSKKGDTVASMFLTQLESNETPNSSRVITRTYSPKRKSKIRWRKMKSLAKPSPVKSDDSTSDFEDSYQPTNTKDKATSKLSRREAEVPFEILKHNTEKVNDTGKRNTSASTSKDKGNETSSGWISCRSFIRPDRKDPLKISTVTGSNDKPTKKFRMAAVNSKHTRGAEDAPGNRPTSSKLSKNAKMSIKMAKSDSELIPRQQRQKPHESPLESSNTDFSDSDADSDVPYRLNASSNNTTKTLARRRRKPYTENERLIILKYIVDHDFYMYTRGNKIWMYLKHLGILRDRTYQSLKEHYRKNIFPNIKKFKLDDAVVKKFKEAHRNKRKVEAPIDIVRMEIIR